MTDLASTTLDLPARGLYSSRSSFRLNQIDKIRANGVGEYVSLPQLVVCGDQSSGKSSVLERVTSIPFPRQEGLCTRFPTEIILRHTQDRLQVSANIFPSICRSRIDQQRLRAYNRQLSDVSELPHVINECATLMGIRGDASTKQVNAFARDVLRIEIVGPVGLHLTIVDLPGLISVSNEDQTGEDVRIVHDLVEYYLASTRTIIMAVVQASNDVANQQIVQLARKHDPEGQRTIGIITKPDLINSGTEGRIAILAKNLDSVKLKLGFFLLKNPTPAEIKDGLSWDDCARRETAFFSQPVWTKHKLDDHRVGAESLRLFLQDILDKHIEKELPKVREEITRQLETAQAELIATGMERPTAIHVRSFLTDLSMRFCQLSQAALDGNYQGHDQQFFSRAGSRLRAMIHEANGDFAEILRIKGQKRKLFVQTSINNHATSDDWQTETVGNDEPQGSPVAQTETKAWVHEVYTKTRGRELPGNYNHALLAELFHEQSSVWPSFATDHVNGVLTMVYQWVDDAIDAIVKEEPLQREISSICRSNLETAKKCAHEELAKLISDEKGHPITYNHYYTDNVQKARQDKQDKAIKDAICAIKDDWGGKLHVSNIASQMDRLLQAVRSKVVVNMDDQACSEALAGLNAYYKVAMKTFIDNCCRQVIERHILSALPKLFYPKIVSEFDDEELFHIGSEPRSQKTRRAELRELARGFRQSLTDLQNPCC